MITGQMSALPSSTKYAKPSWPLPFQFSHSAPRSVSLRTASPHQACALNPPASFQREKPVPTTASGFFLWCCSGLTLCLPDSLPTVLSSVWLGPPPSLVPSASCLLLGPHSDAICRAWPFLGTPLKDHSSDLSFPL